MSFNKYIQLYKHQLLELTDLFFVTIDYCPTSLMLGHSALEIGPCLVLINNAKHF